MAHPNITDELLEYMKELVLQFQSSRISMAQDNNRIFEKSEDPVVIVQHKPEA